MSVGKEQGDPSGDFEEGKGGFTTGGALEFYKLNIYKIKAVDNSAFDKEINSSLKRVIKLINK